MRYAWDENKSLDNIRERGFSFELGKLLDFETAVVREDTRHDYGERRFVAHGMIDNRLHVMCFMPIPDGIRVISLRKANKREVKRYEQETKTTYQ